MGQEESVHENIIKEREICGKAIARLDKVSPASATRVRIFKSSLSDAFQLDLSPLQAVLDNISGFNLPLSSGPSEKCI